VDKANALRAQAGVAPLQRETTRESCADLQVRNDALSGVMYGGNPGCLQAAQNECQGSDGYAQSLLEQCLQGFYDEGPGSVRHDALMNAAYTGVACGFFAATDGSIWSLQNFY
jgi:hypothetical protein